MRQATALLLSIGLLLSAPLAVQAQPTVDGQTTDGKYVQLGTSPAEPGGAFTGGIVGLNAYAGPDSLYVAVEGQVRNKHSTPTRSIVLFINSSSVNGIDAGTHLPPGSEPKSPFIFVDSMQMDMETDFGIRLTGDQENTWAFASFADYAGYVAGDSTDDGEVKDSFEKTLTSLDGTPEKGGATGGTYAYDDTSDVKTVDGTGFEFALPHDSLGTSASDEFQFFAVYGKTAVEDTLSATLIPDDGETTLYSVSEDWTAVDGMQATAFQLLNSPITLDGQLNESEYIPLGTNVDAADGFSPTNDVDSLVYYPDETREMLHVAVAGTLETESTNGYALFLNVEGSGAPTGAAAGDTLGFPSETTNYHFLSGDESGNNTDFTADFEVDYVVAASPNAGSDTTVGVAASYTGNSPEVTALDTTDESGSVGMGAGPNGEMISFAHLNSEDPLTGAEFKIPFSELGASASNNVRVFAVIVSGTGYFSNETIPGDGTQIASDVTDGDGNPGNNAQWSAYAGGPYHTGGDGLPVELASFTARRNGDGAVLNWKTASETNNAGFAVQHAIGSGGFQQIGWVEGAGTTTEAQTYRFVTEDLSAGTHRFRLRQEDLDGSASLSKVVEVEVRPEGPIAIQKVAPNPVTGTSTLHFTTRESESVTVELYDVLGRQVKTLHEGRVSAGQPQRITFDASTLSSGVYFLRVHGENFTETRRLTVVQ